MRALIQRVSSSSVEVDNKIVGSIKKGLVVFLGITHDDSDKEIDFISNKILNLRIFGDDNTENFEKSIIDINGELLIISQFTLYGETKKGRRVPKFIDAEIGYQVIHDEVPSLDLEIIIFLCKFLISSKLIKGSSP